MVQVINGLIITLLFSFSVHATPTNHKQCVDLSRAAEVAMKEFQSGTFKGDVYNVVNKLHLNVSPYKIDKVIDGAYDETKVNSQKDKRFIVDFYRTKVYNECVR